MNMNKVNFFLRRGNQLSLNNRIAEAIDAYHEAVKLKPDTYQAWLNIGMLLLELGNEMGAENAFEKFLQYSPLDEESNALRNFAAQFLLERGCKLPPAPEYPVGNTHSHPTAMLTLEIRGEATIRILI